MTLTLGSLSSTLITRKLNYSYARSRFLCKQGMSLTIFVSYRLFKVALGQEQLLERIICLPFSSLFV
jgi:hypothetical protein